MTFKRLTDFDLKGKRVFIRADLNVPVKDGKVTSDARITASMPTIEQCLKAGARVMVTSHLGRPEEGVYAEENSLKPVADVMAAKLGKPVRVIRDWVDGGFEVAAGEVVLLENCRFNKGEKKNARSHGKEVRRPVRSVCHGRLRHRASRRSLDLRRGAVRPGGLCRPAGGRGTRSADQGAGDSGAADGGHRRRFQGIDQADGARSPVRKSSTRWWSAAASPTPSSRPVARMSASRCARTTWCRRPRP